jgi:hypothetical protein
MFFCVQLKWRLPLLPSVHSAAAMQPTAHLSLRRG